MKLEAALYTSPEGVIIAGEWSDDALGDAFRKAAQA